MSDERRHEPTAQRRRQAREQGQVAKSQDLVAAVVLFSLLIALWLFGRDLFGFLATLCRQQLGTAPTLRIGSDEAVFAWRQLTMQLAMVLGPVLGLMLLAALSAHWMQSGFVTMGLRFRGINPLERLARLFSLANVGRSGFGLIKLLVVLAVLAWSLTSQWATIVALTALETGVLAVRAADVVLLTSLRLTGALLVLGVVDYGYQRWKHERDLRMTDQELREELRLVEGDPQLASQRRVAALSLRKGIAEARRDVAWESTPAGRSRP